jgi:hypothetical protein
MRFLDIIADTCIVPDANRSVIRNSPSTGCASCSPSDLAVLKHNGQWSIDSQKLSTYPFALWRSRLSPADRQASSSGKDARNCILLPSDILANVVQETDGHPFLVRELPQRDVPKSWFVSAAPMPSAGVRSSTVALFGTNRTSCASSRESLVPSQGGQQCFTEARPPQLRWLCCR